MTYQNNTTLVMKKVKKHKKITFSPQQISYLQFLNQDI